MVVNANTGVPSRNAKIRKAFRPHSQKLDLLYGRNSSLQFQIDDLETLLEKGEGIYWVLDRDEDGKIERIIPLSSTSVAVNLLNSGRKPVTDVFADFNSRL